MQHEVEQGFHKGSGNGSANPEVTGQAAPGLQAQPAKSEPFREALRCVFKLGVGAATIQLPELGESELQEIEASAMNHCEPCVSVVAKELLAQMVAPAVDPSARVELPAAISEGALLPWAPELVEILGRPNFACAGIAELLRFDGTDIPNEAEHEQARVIHWLLNHYLQHGAAWRMLAEAELVRIGDLARERKRNGLCGDGGPHRFTNGWSVCTRCRARKPEGSGHA